MWEFQGITSKRNEKRNKLVFVSDTRLEFKFDYWTVHYWMQQPLQCLYMYIFCCDIFSVQMILSSAVWVITLHVLNWQIGCKTHLSGFMSFSTRDFRWYYLINPFYMSRLVGIELSISYRRRPTPHTVNLFLQTESLRVEKRNFYCWKSTSCRQPYVVTRFL